MKDSSEAFAAFTLNKINRSLNDEPLTDAQIEAIKAALVASKKSERHAVDIRLQIPLIFRSYYLIIFAGRDRRTGVISMQRLRWSRSLHRILRTVRILALFLLSFLLGGGIIYLLYQAKSALGIDLIPGFHLSEFVSNFFGK